jgi:hypothetical protein
MRKEPRVAKRKARRDKTDGIAITLHGDTATGGSWNPVIEISSISWDREVAFEMLWPDDESKKCAHVDGGTLGEPVPGFYVLTFKTKKQFTPCQFVFPTWKQALNGEVLTCMIVRGPGVFTRVFPVVKKG